jgi:hypothetical protein
MVEFLLILMLAAIGLLTIGYIVVRSLIRLTPWKPKPSRVGYRVISDAVRGAAFLIVIYSFASYVTEKLRGPDEVSVDINFGHFYRHMVAGRYNEAYNRMVPEYRSSHSIEEFAKEYSFVPDYMPIPGRYLEVSGSEATYHPDQDHFPINGPIYTLRKHGELWLVAGYSWSLD